MSVRPEDALARARQLHRAGDAAGAKRLLEALIDRPPARGDAVAALAGLLLDLGETATARALMESRVAAAPRDATARQLLGLALLRQGDVPAAARRFREAGALDPRAAKAWLCLGHACLLLDDAPQAVTALRRAVRLQPRDTAALRLLATALRHDGQLDEALATAGRAVAGAPRSAAALVDRATIALAMRRPEDAARDVERALALAPDDRQALRTSGAIARQQGRYDDAARIYRALLSRNPEDYETMFFLANLCNYNLGDHTLANALYRRALAKMPGDAGILANYCDSLMNSRRGDEGGFIDEAHRLAAELVDNRPVPPALAYHFHKVFLRSFDHARLGRCGDPGALMEYWAQTDNVAALHNQLGSVRDMADRRRLLAAHRAWGTAVEAAQPVRLASGARVRSGGSRIRLGLMSSDLRDHPVAYFVQPLIRGYDRSRFALHCYSFHPAPPDAVQSGIADAVDVFRPLAGRTDAEAAAAIHADGLDMLIELGGSTKYNRLKVMSWRAAPVQASWLGYPHSCGLATIDRILVDPWLEPPDPALLIERPMRVPESWVCVGPPGFVDEPIDPALPEARKGFLTFGTMNNPYKYSPRLIALWSRVMAAVPGSRFLFVRPEAGAARFRANIAAAFAAYGIAAERVLFEPARGTHLRHYNRIDIGLDTAPHTGGTTTCESLWMGVPLVTLVGPAFFERLSYSNLANAGLGDLCAHSEDEYVAIALALAADRARRQELRRGLRPRLAALPLGDQRRWVADFEATVRRTLDEGA